MLWRFWGESPSVDDLFAAFVGLKPSGQEDHISSQEELLAFTLFAGGVKHG